jgi:acetyl-CoA carboxylase biotin carboxyl carrier protein
LPCTIDTPYIVAEINIAAAGGAKKGSINMDLTHADIADIIKLMESSTLDEIVVEAGGVRVEARRRGALAARTDDEAPIAPAAAMATPIATAAVAPAVLREEVAAASAPLLAAPQLSAGQVAVTAPMVGTFYRRPSPDAPSFVEVGSKVAVGDPLCLVEVMKLFTTISATVAGMVAQVCADDAQLVEFDQVLFVINQD